LLFWRSAVWPRLGDRSVDKLSVIAINLAAVFLCESITVGSFGLAIS
jgi:hypothetical protein